MSNPLIHKKVIIMETRNENESLSPGLSSRASSVPGDTYISLEDSSMQGSLITWRRTVVKVSVYPKFDHFARFYFLLSSDRSHQDLSFPKSFSANAWWSFGVYWYLKEQQDIGFISLDAAVGLAKDGTEWRVLISGPIPHLGRERSKRDSYQ